MLNYIKKNSIFGNLLQFLGSELLFSAYISPFYVLIYNSKTGIGILNAALDFKLEL